MSRVAHASRDAHTSHAAPRHPLGHPRSRSPSTAHEAQFSGCGLDAAAGIVPCAHGGSCVASAFGHCARESSAGDAATTATKATNATSAHAVTPHRVFDASRVRRIGRARTWSVVWVVARARQPTRDDAFAAGVANARAFRLMLQPCTNHAGAILFRYAASRMTGARDCESSD